MTRRAIPRPSSVTITTPPGSRPARPSARGEGTASRTIRRTGLEAVGGGSATLGLRETCIASFEADRYGGWLARGYDYDILSGGVPLVVGDSVVDGGFPDGGVLASAPDMTQFHFGLFADKTLLGGASLKEMTAPDPGATAEAGAGLHLFVRRNGAFGHDGSISGFQACMYYYPESEMAIAMWTNGSGDRCEALWEEVWTRVETFLTGAPIGRTT